MNRRDFLKQCALWAASIPAVSLLAGCADEKILGLYTDFEVNFQGSVLVIGAGASGLAAGYLLGRYGIDYQVIEASSGFGGRVKRADDFADFPIDLGAEWIHEDPSVLASLIDDPGVDGAIEVVPYSPASISTRDGRRLSSQNWTRNYYQEYKFKNTTWYGFLERYIAPTVLPNTHFDQPVATIDTSGEGVVVITEDGSVFEADRVIVTVPVKVLQDGLITFIPELSEDRIAALDRIHVPHGIKVFTEFDRCFYPDLVLDGGLFGDTSSDKLYYNAAFKKKAERHVMGLFWVSDDAASLTALPSDDAIVEAVIEDLDSIFAGKASRHFVKSIVQNWSAEPFIRGAYSVDFDGAQQAIVDTLTEPIDGLVFFSGEAMSVDNGATVPGAMESAYSAVEQLLLD